MAEKSGAVWQAETGKLSECVNEVERNITLWIEKKKDIDARTKQLYDHYHSGNPELESDLKVSLDLQGETEKTLRRNRLAKAKPYFGRIDFSETGRPLKQSQSKAAANKDYSLYIGKNGIAREDNTALITDWRAPVSGVYYESNIGPGGYEAPAGRVEIDLKLKRTYEIEDSSLLDYYDTDVIANDEFLMKYLSKNKEVVLGEIIATIQKEQDEIIRAKPWHTVIVQGVAGSGKTTVAMHRISYLLYNYKETFRPSEFYIIGSNRMLLNYITGVLPDLDVYNANQMTMDELFAAFLSRDRSVRKYHPVTADEEAAFKGTLRFVKAFERFLAKKELDLIPMNTVEYDGAILMTRDDILTYMEYGKDKSTRDQIESLNDRLAFLLQNYLERGIFDPVYVRAEQRKYRNYFGSRLKKINLPSLYSEFLMSLLHPTELTTFHPKDVDALLRQVSKGRLDVYDLCMLLLAHNRILRTEGLNQIKHMVIDEAQDFGVSIFYVLKKLLKNCTFTIMGDVSQNIHYDTGMNDWSQIRSEVFSPVQDRFYVLAKSYRNTVEISEFAGNILSKCSFETYQIEPVIRRGKPVARIKAENEQDLIDKTAHALREMQDAGYTTLAVICRNEKETAHVQTALAERMEIAALDEENPSFTKGVMVLPIRLTKGLEFDAVVLFNPSDASYRATDADAKLLYVAATRALHELQVIYSGRLCDLLN